MKHLSRRRFLGCMATAGGAMAVVPSALSANLLFARQRLSINLSAFGFQGHRLDLTLGVYHTGNGYRIYDPAIYRFMQYDREMSPFGAGGLNGYAYVMNDPFNQIDPDGRFSFGAFFRGLISAIVSVVAFVITVATAGVAAPLAIGLAGVAMAAGVVSGAMEMTIAAIDDPDHPATKVLSIVKQASDIVGAVTGIASGGASILKSGTKTLGMSASKVTGFSSKNIAKQISHAGKWDLVGFAGEVGGLAGVTMETVGAHTDNEALKFSGSLIKFGSGLAKSGAKTTNATKVKYKTNMSTFKTKTSYSIDPAKRPERINDLAKQINNLGKTSDKALKFAGVDESNRSGTNEPSLSGAGNSANTTRQFNVQEVAHRSRNTQHRHWLYSRYRSSGESFGYGLERLA